MLLLLQVQAAPTSLLQQYKLLELQWVAQIFPYASRLFGLLAVIEVAWAAITLLLERADFQSWVGGFVRIVMSLGAFWALLLFAPQWLPLIVSSFVQVGQHASGTPALQPGDVFLLGMNIAGILLKAAASAGFVAKFGMALALVLAGICIFLCFVGICLQLTVALIESYLSVAAGMIFLGFGGSRWTRPYVERLIALAVATGVKLFMIYLLVGVGQAVSSGWVLAASLIPGSPEPAMGAWSIAGAAVVYLGIVWQIPKWVAGLLGGAPALTGGDVAGMVSSGITAITAAAVAGTAGAAALARGAAGGGSAVQQVAAAAGMRAAGGGAPPPPPGGAPGPSPANGGGGGGQPAAPKAAGTAGGGNGFGPGVAPQNIAAVAPSAGSGGSSRPDSVPAPSKLPAVMGGVATATRLGGIAVAGAANAVPSDGASISGPSPNLQGKE